MDENTIAVQENENASPTTTILTESISFTVGNAQVAMNTRSVRLPRDKAHLIREMEQVHRAMVFMVYVGGDGIIKFIVKQPSDFESLK